MSNIMYRKYILPDKIRTVYKCSCSVSVSFHNGHTQYTLNITGCSTSVRVWRGWVLLPRNQFTIFLEIMPYNVRLRACLK